MRVLIVYHAGAMHNPRQLYRALADVRGITLTVVVPRRLKVDRVYDPSGWLTVEREEDANSYRLVPVPLRNPLSTWQGFDGDRLRRVIRQVHPDIIHVLDEPTSGYLFQVVWQRLTTSPRSQVLFYAFSNLPIQVGLLSRLKWRFTWAQMAGGAAANSEALENLKHAGFPANRLLERIFWGISLDVFRPMDSAFLKRELRLECDHIVGFAGRLVPEKGVTVLLASMRYLPSSVHCLIIGNGPMRADIELWGDLPGLHGRVHLLDAMPPEMLARYMNCMDILVVPSLTMPQWKEQYGRVIGEAMACGVPVIGSDSGAIPEVIGPDGLIVPEGDASALAKAAHQAIFDKEVRDRLRQHGADRSERELSVKAMSERLVRFYAQVLGS